MTGRQIGAAGAAVVALAALGFGLSAAVKTDSRLTLTAASSVTLSPPETFQQAYQQAPAGGTVAVNGGIYTADYPAEGAAKLLPVGKTGPVTFVCGDGQPVTFASPADQFVITAPDVTFRGSCFHFNRLWVGDGSNGVSTTDVTIDGVSMWIFDISGSSNVTVENSTIGPDVACHAPGFGAFSCQNIVSDNEAYWFASGRENGRFNEPKIHDGGNTGSVPSVSVTIKNNLFQEITSRDPVAYHAGCLWLGYASTGGPVTVTGNTFTGCMAYDIHVDTPQTPNVNITGNTLASPRDALRGLTDFSQVPIEPYNDIEVKCQDSETLVSYTLTGNTFTNGWDLNNGGCVNPSYPGLVISGNNSPPIQIPPQPQGPPVTTSESTSTASSTVSTTTTATTATTTSPTTTATTSTTTSINVPLSISEDQATLNGFVASKKVGGLGYSVVRAKTTHAYKALVALNGSWP